MKVLHNCARGDGENLAFWQGWQQAKHAQLSLCILSSLLEGQHECRLMLVSKGKNYVIGEKVNSEINQVRQADSHFASCVQSGREGIEVEQPQERGEYPALRKPP